MRVKWRDFELPNQVVVNKETKTDKYGKFVIEPFERGFGVTVGNSLRRVLLSSLEGAAIYALKVEGVTHEFTGIKGVLQDVTDIILRLKQVRVRIHEGDEAELRIEKKTKGVVTAADIQCPSNVDVINQDLALCELSEDVPFNATLLVRRGRGYVTASELDDDSEGNDTIFIDACFSPVIRVRYNTEETRVGQKTNYDRLIFEIWTDGITSPEDALVESSKILRKHLNAVVQYNLIGSAQLPVANLKEIGEGAGALGEPESEENKTFARSIADLDLTVRAKNCLEAAEVKTVGKLVALTEQDLLKIDNLGKTTVNEIKRRLEEWNLTLGMIPYQNTGKVEV